MNFRRSVFRHDVTSNGVLHGCDQQRAMEPIQTVAIAQSRQGVGDACGVEPSRRQPGILGIPVCVRAPSATSGKRRQDYFRYGSMSPTSTAPGSGSTPPEIIGSAR